MPRYKRVFYRQLCICNAKRAIEPQSQMASRRDKEQKKLQSHKGGNTRREMVGEAVEAKEASQKQEKMIVEECREFWESLGG